MTKPKVRDWRVEAVEPRKRTNAILVVRASSEEAAVKRFRTVAKREVRTGFGVPDGSWPIVSVTPHAGFVEGEDGRLSIVTSTPEDSHERAQGRVSSPDSQ